MSHELRPQPRSRFSAQSAPEYATAQTHGIGPPRSEHHPSALRYYLAILRRRKTVAAVCFLFPLALSIAYSVLQDPLYQGTARVLLSRQNLANALTGTPDPTAQVNDFIRIVQTQASLARSPAVADLTLKRIGSKLSSDQFLSQSSVEPARNADILTFKAWSKDPREALALTNAYAPEFANYRVTLDTASLRRAQREVFARIQNLNETGASGSRLAQSLEDKAQELDTLEALQTSNATVIGTASKAEQIAPKTIRNLLLGLMGGVVLAALAVLARETFDTRVRSEEEIEDRLGLTPLARIGPPSRSLRGQLVMLARPNDPAAESFRLLRTNLQFAAINGRPRSLLVTSAMQGEGKSTTIANLAVAMARSGDRVILVDLDLRRPSMRRLFSLKSELGLTDVALGSTTLDDALEPIDLRDPANPEHGGQRGGSLAVLGTGALPPNPGEFIESDATAAVVERVHEHCDVVLIDAPPSLLLGDALVLSRLAEAVFVCVRVPLVTRSALDDLRRALVTARARTLGFVITGHRDTNGGYGYGYGYAHTGAQADAPAPSRPEPAAHR